MPHPDLASLLPKDPLERRGFLKASVGLGFAACALPVAAETILTDPEGLDTGKLTIDSGGQQVPLYYAKPHQAGHKIPVVLVVSEIFGLHEHIADVARRFAKLGYLAVAPDFFIRQGNPLEVPSIQQLLQTIIRQTPDSEVAQDVQAALAWAAANGGDAKRMGVTGFCWGGRVAWMAATMPEVRAAVAWYGRLEGESNPHTPSYPIDWVNRLRAPVLGLYGGADRGIPRESVAAMRARLAAGAAAASAAQIVVYPDAPHAFHADYRPSYREEAAKDGWKRCLEWFRQFGVA